MKNKKNALRNLAVLTLIVSCFIACDKDFANIDSDIINNENATHFNTTSRDFDVIAYTKSLGPVQTDGLPVNFLGVYRDPIYGTTTASIVTEVESSIINPTFGTNAVLDSVILNIPYFSTPTSVEDDGETIYELDSVFGSAPIKLSIFESNYFLRDFDPSGEISDTQNYYSNMSTGLDFISSAQLEATPILIEDDDPDEANVNIINNFIPSPEQIRLEDEEGELVNRIVPALRVKLDTTYWRTKIFDKEGEPELSNANNFNDYFRGIYFKTEAINNNGNLSLLNLVAPNANITIHYRRDNDVEGEDPVNSTLVINFRGNRVNFISNDFNIQSGNDITGDENLFLKGGQGSIAEIKLFNGEDLDDDNTNDNAFETFKKEFVETDEDGNFISSKKLINEANLVFYVNQDLVNADEPERIYLYDVDNNSPLTDYFLDNANTSFPEFSLINHLGRLQRYGDEPTAQGEKYKIKITEHINNLLLRDSTNVKLGLSISGNVNLEGNAQQFDVLNGSDTEETVPLSSITSPRGTILIGNNTSNEEKKLYLEIFFTEPNN
ncbi:DUF4270 domain-containing protein [uncultured Psychroserpens sp.]|uniref:DUF4270 domain-containing protein n=1 Tax=uncultured Psychroserpens sp. TaxID=255436 RepID=UPI00261DA455|nr:DUF4270 domain-containing protein [uncultured Psychroserpens sp.]